MSLRARVTLAFAAVLATVLGAAGAYLYLQFGHDLRETQERGLRARAAELAAQRPLPARLPDPGPTDTDEEVAQVLASDGTVLAASAAVPQPLLSRAQVAEALRREAFFDRAGDAVVDESLRLFARPTRVDGRPAVAVAGGSSDEIAESLSRLLALEVAGLGAALMLGAAGAWLIAGVVVRPVQRALDRERRFVADASHELRTPLAVLKAELDVSRMEGGDPEATLASAREEVDRLSRLAEDLLVLARADESGLPLRLSAVQVGELLRRSARDGVRVDAPALTITGDELRLQQAIGNLVDNALRHGAPPVELSAERRDGGVVIAVRDHGPGIPAAFAERAFDRFARADAGRTAGGAGLGLSIARAIARAHGGDVRLQPGAPGLIAELTLPNRSLMPDAQP